jgi:hypothetical protein
MKKTTNWKINEVIPMSKIYLTTPEAIAANQEVLAKCIAEQGIPMDIIKMLGGLVVLPTKFVNSKVFSITRHADGEYGVLVSLTGTCREGQLVPGEKGNYNFSLKGWLNMSLSADENSGVMPLTDKEATVLETWLTAAKDEKENLFINFNGHPIVLCLCIEEVRPYVLDSNGNKIQVGVKTDGSPVYQLSEPQPILTYSAGFTHGKLGGKGTSGSSLTMDAVNEALERFAAMTK